MTTFHAIIYAIVHGFAEIMPIGATAHRVVLPYLAPVPAAPEALVAVLCWGTLLAILVYFRHDWASIISGFLGIFLLRRRPMTLDERMPFFLLIGSLPSLAAWYYFRENAAAAAAAENPLWIALGLATFSIPLWLADSSGRKNKGMFDWNWLDALLAGAFQALIFIPGGGAGFGRIAAILTIGLFRGFTREAAAKFAFFLGAPALIASAYAHSHGLMAAAPIDGSVAEISKLSLGVAFVLTTITSLLVLGGFMRQLQRKGFGGFIFYRCLLAAAVIAVYWYRSR